MIEMGKHDIVTACGKMGPGSYFISPRKCGAGEISRRSREDLREFVQDIKAGLVAQLIAHYGVPGVAVPPA